MTTNISPQCCDQQPCTASRKSARRSFVYALTDANGVRYVGRSKDPVTRVTQHASSRTIVGEWLRGGIEQGQKPRLRILFSADSDAEAAVLEIAAIEAHRGPLLLNTQHSSGPIAVRETPCSLAIDIDSVGCRLRALRSARGIGLRQLARLSGVGPATISRIELGKCPEPTAEALVRVARILGTTCEYLLTGEGEP